MLENPESYDIVFSRADPGGRCTITDDTITLSADPDDHADPDEYTMTLRELYDRSISHPGVQGPFWRIQAQADSLLRPAPPWTGRFYIEDNAQLRVGRIVVEFSSTPPTATTIADAAVGNPMGSIRVFYNDDCTLRVPSRANRHPSPSRRLGLAISHEFGHALGFYHTSPTNYPDSLMNPGSMTHGLQGYEVTHWSLAYHRARGARRATGWPGGIPVGFSGLQRPAYPVRLPPIRIRD